MIAYDNSIGAGQVGVYSIGVRIYNPITKAWTYETVRDKKASRYCYPFAFVSERYYHVQAVEDMYDTNYALLTPPHNTYQFRYGAVKHFQRLRTGGPWEEATILDFNNKPNIGKQQIADASLIIMDFTVDSENVVHAILKYNGT